MQVPPDPYCRIEMFLDEVLDFSTVHTSSDKSLGSRNAVPAGISIQPECEFFAGLSIHRKRDLAEALDSGEALPDGFRLPEIKGR